MIIGGIVGFILGSLCGVGLMCMIQINASEEDQNENM